MKRLELIGSGNSLQEAILINRDVLEVSVDGFGRSKIIAVGTPVDKEVKYDQTTGTLTFPESLSGEQVFVLYQDL
jgi:hypothetical protein